MASTGADLSSEIELDEPTKYYVDSARLTPRQLKGKLEDHLASECPTGVFGLSGTVSKYCNPGLSVKDVGLIGLPLCDRDVKALISASHQAPYGKGKDTVVDESVRKTWEINANQIELRCPSWRDELQGILAKVMENMGIEKIDRAELYKMLIYEEGAISEKSPGMFGTLAICLSSPHAGGEVIVKHGDKSLVLDTSKGSAFDLTYLAWYSDVLHEIKPVTSGHRVVLTYNLIKANSTAELPRALDLNSNNKDIARLLLAWPDHIDKHKLSCPPMLAYRLGHKYTDSSLKFANIKGDDRRVMLQLEDICKDINWTMYLANIERVIVAGGEMGPITGNCHGMWDSDDRVTSYDGGYHSESDSESESDNGDCEIVEDDVSLTNIVDRADKVVASRTGIHRACIIQREIFGDEPDQEDCEYTGNEGASATEWYRETLVLLMPKEHTVNYFLRADAQKRLVCSPHDSDHIASKWLGDLLKTYKQSDQDPCRRQEIYQELTAVCNVIVETSVDAQKAARFSRPEYYDYLGIRTMYRWDTIALALEVAVMLMDAALFLNLLRLDMQDMPDSGFVQVAKGIHTFGTEDIEHRTIQLVTSVKQYSMQFQKICTLAESLPKDSTRCNEWVGNAIEASFMNCSMISESDGLALVNTIAFCLGRGIWTTIREQIVKVIYKPTTNTLALITFLERLYKVHQSIIGATIADEMFQIAAPTLIRHIDIKMCAATKKMHTHPHDAVRTVTNQSLAQRRAEPSAISTQGTIPGPQVSLGFLMEKCLDLGLDKDVELLELALIRAASSLPVDCFHNLFLPMLAQILPRSTSQPSRVILYERVFRGILQLFINRVVKTEPRLTTGLARPPCGCGCDDCKALDAFMIAPVASEWRFSAAQRRRSHLEGQLYSTTCRSSTEQNRSPYTLVVTKDSSAAAVAHLKWESRCKAARVDLAFLDGPRLKELLSHNYESIMSLKVGELPARAALVPISHNATAARSVAAALPLEVEAEGEPATGVAISKTEPHGSPYAGRASVKVESKEIHTVGLPSMKIESGEEADPGPAPKRIKLEERDSVIVID